jgi:hypothetical protein
MSAEQNIDNSLKISYGKDKKKNQMNYGKHV